MFILVKIKGCTNSGIVNTNKIISILPSPKNEFESIIHLDVLSGPDILKVDEPTGAIELKICRPLSKG